MLWARATATLDDCVTATLDDDRVKAAAALSQLSQRERRAWFAPRDHGLWCHSIRVGPTARRGWYSSLPRGKLPRAFGTYNTQEAATRSPYVQYGVPGA